MSERVEYFIKFVKEESHAKALQNGVLFMRPIVAFIKMYYDEYFDKFKEFDDNTFYHYMKTYSGCIGDIREGLLQEDIMVRGNTCIPVYCLTYIKSSQIQDEGNDKIIKFNKKLIDEFLTSNYHYAVLIKCDDFIENLNSFYNEEYKNDTKKEIGSYGPVYYKKRNTPDIIHDCWRGNNLYYKNPIFNYQQEFRITLNRAVARYSAITYKDRHVLLEYESSDIQLKNGVELKELPSYSTKINPIKNYSKIFNLSDFNLINENYELKFKDKNYD